MKVLLTITFASGLVFSQPAASDLVARPLTVRELPSRLVSSRYVLRGLIEDRQFIRSRDSESLLKTAEEVVRQTGTFDLSKIETGLLYRIQVKGILCQASNFSNQIRAEQPSAEIFVFLPSGGWPSIKGQFSESFIVGQEYLLFLVDDPERDQNLAAYPLEPTKNYYRAIEYGRGVVPLTPVAAKNWAPGQASFLLNAAGSLCEAVQPPNMLQKRDSLERLKSSPGVEIRDAADTLLKMLANIP